MGTYIKWNDAYAREDVFGTSAIPDTDAITYLFGAVNQESSHPSPRTDVIFGATSVGEQEVDADGIWKGNYEMSGMYGMSAQNGILLQAVMGKSVTQDDTPSAGLFTHTITPPTPVSGVLPLLPSFTIQHERTGTATDWSTQWVGMKVSNLKLICKFDDPRTLIFIADWMAKKALKVAFTLTPDPVLPPTKNVAPYHFNNFTREIDLGEGFADIDGLREMELSINPGLMPEYTRSQVAGVDTSMWPKGFTERPRKDYVLILRLHPSGSEMWEEVVDYGDHLLSLDTTLDGATETAVVVTTAIPAGTPSAGTLRIELDSEVYRTQSYTSWTGSTFTIPETDYSGANVATAGNDVCIVYADIRFKWIRHSTDDYIQCDLLDCQFTWHELKTPDPRGGVELIEEVTIKPRACSFIVVDKIDGYPYYGEAE